MCRIVAYLFLYCDIVSLVFAYNLLFNESICETVEGRIECIDFNSPDVIPAVL